MSKFGSIEAEAAYAIANHGFAQGEFGSSTEGSEWNALVYVSPVVLRNVGESELAEQIPTTPQYVWIRESSDGLVDVRESVVDGITRTQHVIQRFEESQADHFADPDCEDC